MLDRRQFLTHSAAAAAAFSSAAVHAEKNERSQQPNPLVFFSKPFNSLSFDELAAKTAALGFQGLEAPIRAKGNVEPEAVAEELPKLTAALRKHGCAIHIMTSDINDPSAPLTESVLRVAAAENIPFYRLKYFKYEDGKSITQQIDNWAAQLKDLTQMSHELGITPVYQNHAGSNYFGAQIWDVYRAFQKIGSDHIGMAYDIRHATAEAGSSWPIGFRLISDHVKAVYVKDFVWGESTRPVNVPLGEGRVKPEFMKMLAKTGFKGPISLHEEYLDHKDPKLVPQHWEAIEKDLDTLKSWM